MVQIIENRRKHKFFPVNWAVESIVVMVVVVVIVVVIAVVVIVVVVVVGDIGSVQNWASTEIT